MGLYTKVEDEIYRFCLAEAGIKRTNSPESEYCAKCIDDTIASSSGRLNAEHSQTLEDKASNKSKYAVLLIDMQKKFLNKIDKSEKKKQIRSQIEVLQYCSQKDIPAAVLEFNGYGCTIDELAYHINKLPRKRYLEKDRDDGFTNKKLSKQLKEWGSEHVCLMGINASACVVRTGMGAIDKGFIISTADQLIAEPSNWDGNKSIPWFTKNGKYYDDYIDLIKQIDLDTLSCK